MLSDEISKGVLHVSHKAGFPTEQAESVAVAISAQAITDPAGRQALALDRTTGGIIHFNLFKAVTAAAGVLGVAIGATTGALPAVLSALGALGSLQGLVDPLPRSSGLIVSLLMEGENRKLTRDELKDKFKKIYQGPPDESEADLKSGLESLDKSKCVKVEQGTIRLTEYIVIRL